MLKKVCKTMRKSGSVLDGQIEICFSLMLKMEQFFAEYARKKSLTYTGLMVLRIIYEEKSCTQKHISDMTGYPKQTVNMIIRGFQEKEWVELKESSEDRRIKIVSLTPEGMAFATKTIEPFRACAEKAFKVIDAKDRMGMAKALSAFDDAFSIEIKGLLS